MKSLKEFLSESVNISGNATVGTIIISGQNQQQESVGESFFADVVWEGKIYRMEIEGSMMSKNELAEELQGEYPGAIVHNIYPGKQSSSLKIKNSQRYQPERLTWGE